MFSQIAQKQCPCCDKNLSKFDFILKREIDCKHCHNKVSMSSNGRGENIAFFFFYILAALMPYLLSFSGFLNYVYLFLSFAIPIFIFEFFTTSLICSDKKEINSNYKLTVREVIVIFISIIAPILLMWFLLSFIV